MLGWSVADVADWLRAREGFESIADRFESVEIDGEMLLDMKADDLDEILAGEAHTRSLEEKKKEILKAVARRRNARALSKMSVEEVSVWLHAKDCELFVKKFLQLEITGEMLLDLTEEDLAEISVGSKDERRKLLTHVRSENSVCCQDSASKVNDAEKICNMSPIRTLSVETVSGWLRSNKLDMFVSRFAEMEIDGEMLLDLRSEDLHEMDVGSSADRSALIETVRLRAIGGNHDTGSPSMLVVPPSSSSSSSSSEEDVTSAKKVTEGKEIHRRSLKSLSVEEVRVWLSSCGFEAFGHAFEQAEIHGDMIRDLRADDAEDFPALRSERWSGVLRAIKHAEDCGVALRSNDGPIEID